MREGTVAKRSVLSAGPQREAQEKVERSLMPGGRAHQRLACFPTPPDPNAKSRRCFRTCDAARWGSSWKHFVAARCQRSLSHRLDPQLCQERFGSTVDACVFIELRISARKRPPARACGVRSVQAAAGGILIVKCGNLRTSLSAPSRGALAEGVCSSLDKICPGAQVLSGSVDQ